MGLLDALRGRTKQVPPDLDSIFALPSAAVTIETQLNLVPSGHGGLCFKSGSGESSISGEQDVSDLLSFAASNTSVSIVDDELGFTWVTVNDPDISSLVTTIHGANSTLVEHGLGPRMLCAAFGFVPRTPPGDGDLRIIYLMKSGTFYPFAPRQDHRRDNELELRARSFLADDLPMEPDLTRWMALWDLPVS